jgi:hypothetical protein
MLSNLQELSMNSTACTSSTGSASRRTRIDSSTILICSSVYCTTSPTKIQDQSNIDPDQEERVGRGKTQRCEHGERFPLTVGSGRCEGCVGGEGAEHEQRGDEVAEADGDDGAPVGAPPRGSAASERHRPRYAPRHGPDANAIFTAADAALRLTASYPPAPRLDLVRARALRQTPLDNAQTAVECHRAGTFWKPTAPSILLLSGSECDAKL